ncbi:hypothetical protein AB2B38_011965 [Balneola sp. MJW-20]|uniref:baeRF7 domain-containing protein n=1 Tax=Gracilimonas aurantiaca TaxID=3234185 RepID=UPI0034678E1A
MSKVDRETIERLISQTSDTNISIFIPTHKTGAEGKQDPIHLKNILSEVRNELKASGWKDPDIDQLFSPVHMLIEENQFWLHQDKGLAIYFNKNHFDYFKIPVTPNADHYIAENFMITPLLELQNHHGVYHILVLSQNKTRMLKSAPDELTEVAIESVPTSMEEHLKFHVAEKSLQSHSAGNGNNAVFHGQGGEGNSDNKELKLFLKHIENKVTKYMKKVNGPLVLAGTDKIVSYYREANSYYNLIGGSIKGNPDTRRDEETEEAAWSLVEAFFREEIQSDLERFNNLRGGGLISANIKDIVSGAYFGKVDTLFVSMKNKQWGKFDPESNQVQLSSEKTDETVELINFAAVSALRTGSTLYGLSPEQIPETSNLAAIYRYKT